MNCQKQELTKGVVKEGLVPLALTTLELAAGRQRRQVRSHEATKAWDAGLVLSRLPPAS